MKVIYIAGPFRGRTAWEVEKNIRNAETVALAVWKAGAVALCPHTNTRFFDGEGSDLMWLNGTAELLRRSDAILLIPGWRSSAGARMEYELAGDIGKSIFMTVNVSEDPGQLPLALHDWIKCIK